jgi:hypothetical protein
VGQRDCTAIVTVLETAASMDTVTLHLQLARFRNEIRRQPGPAYVRTDRAGEYSNPRQHGILHACFVCDM